MAVMRERRVAPTARDAANLDAARLASYPAGYPAGWVALLPESEIGEAPQSVYVAGKALVVFRGASGTLSVLDAFCPHLGAHLGVGRVCGETLECRFHGWRFSGDGSVVDVPYGRRSPARVASYPVASFYGMACAYLGHGTRSDAPPYALGRHEGIDRGEFTFRGAFDAGEVRTHLLEFAENSADVQHFGFLHREFRVPWTRTPVPLVGLEHSATWSIDEAEPHVCWFVNDASVTFRGRKVEGRGGRARVRIDGPATVVRFEIDLGSRGTVVLFQFHSPKEPLVQHVRFRWFAEKRVPDGLARFVVGHWISQWEQDLEVWETKAYEPQPSLVAQDGPLVGLRRWYAQFYPDGPSTTRAA